MTPNRRSVITIGIAMLCWPVVPSTQTKGNPAFEVASVRRTVSGDAGIFIQTQGETFTARNITLRELLFNAYTGRYLPTEIVGGPSWVDNDRFQIVAKTGRPGAPVYTMVRTLLGQRFGVRTHEELKAMAVYRLVMARVDKRLGPRLSRSRLDCKAAAQGTGERCGFRPGPGSFVSNGTGMPLLATILSSSVQRRVVDRTGLVGDFAIELNWEPEGPDRNGAPGGAPSNSAGDVSIFTAVQEQLGLRLEPGQEMVPVLVIDAVEHPVDD